MNLLYQNQFITTTLSVVGGVDASQTDSIVIQSTTGLDTTKPGIACLSYTDPLNMDNAEFIEYSAINSTTKTFTGVVRGSEGYSAKTHSNGVTIAFPASESHVNRLADALSIGGVATNGVTTTLDEDTMSSDSATALATQQSIKSYVDGGWNSVNETWTFGAIDAPSFTFTIASFDATTKYSVGMRIKLTNASVKYFIITKVTFDDPGSTITVYGGTDYALVDAAITLPYYSTQKAPLGFPLDPSKWSVKLEYTTGTIIYANPATGNVLYSNNAARLELPIGIWNCNYRAGRLSSIRSSGSAHTNGATLSSDGSTETNKDSSWFAGNPASASCYSGPVGQTLMTKASKGYIYLLAIAFQPTSGALDITASADPSSTLVIRAVCAYL